MNRGAENVDLVVFDLGGVLAGFDGVSELKRLTGLDDAELWRVADLPLGPCIREWPMQLGGVREWGCRRLGASSVPAGIP